MAVCQRYFKVTFERKRDRKREKKKTEKKRKKQRKKDNIPQISYLEWLTQIN